MQPVTGQSAYTPSGESDHIAPANDTRLRVTNCFVAASLAATTRFLSQALDNVDVVLGESRKGSTMVVDIGAVFPDLRCDSTHGPISSLHEAFADSWVLFVAQSCEKNAVGTTELGELERLRSEFEERSVKIFVLGLGSSRTGVEAWPADVRAATGYDISFPIIVDETADAASRIVGSGSDKKYLFFLGPDATVRLVMTYPTTTGFSSFEVLRCFDSLLRAQAAKVATPVNWVRGRDCIVVDDKDDDDELPRDFPAGVRDVDLPSGQTYLRLTPDPLVADDDR